MANGKKRKEKREKERGEEDLFRKHPMKAETSENAPRSVRQNSGARRRCFGGGDSRTAPRYSLGGAMASLARVQLSYDEFNGPRVKSYSPTGLGAMSALFMFGMTPRFAGTLFGRPSLWLEVLLLVSVAPRFD